MPIFRVRSVKIYTGQKKKITWTPSVASVTNMRCDLRDQLGLPCPPPVNDIFDRNVSRDSYVPYVNL